MLLQFTLLKDTDDFFFGGNTVKARLQILNFGPRRKLLLSRKTSCGLQSIPQHNPRIKFDLNH
jgi:hypothetical protein